MSSQLPLNTIHSRQPALMRPLYSPFSPHFFGKWALVRKWRMIGGRGMSLIQSYNIVEKSNTYTLIRPGMWYYGTTTCSALIYAGVYVIIAHTLGPHVFGSYLFAQWLATISVPVIGTGMSTLTSRQIAEIQSHEPPRLVAGIFYFLWYRQHRSMLFYCLIYIFLAFLLAQLFHACTPGLLLLTGLSTLPSLLSSIAGTTLRSLRRVDLLAMLHLFGALLSLLFVIIATQVNDKHIEAFILAFALASTITLIVSVVCVVRLLPLEQAIQPGIFLRERLANSLNRSWLIFTLDAIIWQRSELLLLASLYSPAEIGFYALSATISTKAIGLAPTLFSQWLFPLVLRYLPAHRYLNPYDAFIKTSCYIIFLAVPTCTMLIALSPGVIMYCLGEAFLPIVQPLRILLIASVFASAATVSLTHLATNRHICTPHTQRTQTWLNIAIACLKIGLAIPLVIIWGATGAACASAISQIAAALVSILLCQKLLKKHETLLQRG